MRNLITLIGKELKLYFISPIAYVVGAVFLIIVGFLFYNIVAVFARQSLQFMRLQGMTPQLDIHEAVFRPTFLNMGVVLLLVVPILTMRLFSEEKKMKTTELLMTSPLTITEIVLGKYLAAFLVYAVLLALTLSMPLLIGFYSTIDWGPLGSSYLGLLLLGGAFLAVGLFASSLTENQIIAAVISFGTLLCLWILSVAARTIGSSTLGGLLNYLSLYEHLDNFIRGLVDTSDLIFYLSFIAFGLFLTHRVVESQRWK
jgi:gliding motility-associated transport system permease protein